MYIESAIFLLALQGLGSTLSATGHTPYDPGRTFYTPDKIHRPAPYIAQTKLDPKYPLQVHVIQMSPHLASSGFEGYGAGDLLGTALTGTASRGMDFTYHCQKVFVDNRNTAGFYQARWKKPNDTIEFLLMRADGKREATCSAKVFFRSKPYSQFLSSASESR